MIRNIDTFKKSVASKLNQYKDKLVIPGVRDEELGFAYTAQRIMQSAENFFFAQSDDVYEPVEAMYASFAEGPGLGDVSNVRKVDVMDIDIMATFQSIIGYLAIERKMDASVVTMFYQCLTALNNAGGFNAGDTVYNPFRPISTALDLAASTATVEYTNENTVAADVTISIGKTNLQKGSVVITAKLSGDVVGTLMDVKNDGILYSSTGSIVTAGTVNYETGVVTLTGLAASSVVDTLMILATIDATAEYDGASTLKVKPKATTKQIEATPKRIILENSYEDAAYMNKTTYELQSAGVSMDYTKRSIKSLIHVFVTYLDYMCIDGLYSMIYAMTPLERDLTGYSLVGSEASTKNDKLNGFVIALNSKLQKQSGFGPSCYVCDTEGAALLGNNPMYFTANAAFDQNLNGVVGTYRGLPVIRHFALDGKAGEGYALIAAVQKKADGSMGPLAFGEFLPPFSVRPALNFMNPAQFATGLFATNTVEPIVPELIAWMKVKVN